LGILPDHVKSAKDVISYYELIFHYVSGFSRPDKHLAMNSPGTIKELFSWISKRSRIFASMIAEWTPLARLSGVAHGWRKWWALGVIDAPLLLCLKNVGFLSKTLYRSMVVFHYRDVIQ